MTAVVNDVGDFEPDEFAFFVIVGATTPVTPTSTVEHSRNGNGGIDQRTPGSSRTSLAETRADCRQRLAIVVGCPHAAAGGEQVAEERRIAFVDPEQVRL